jgi:hypothetical protein
MATCPTDSVSTLVGVREALEGSGAREGEVAQAAKAAAGLVASTVLREVRAALAEPEARVETVVPVEMAVPSP